GQTVRTTGTAFRILAQRCGRGYTAGRLNRGAKCSTPPERYREGAKTMSTLVRRSALPEIEYPTSDGKPMAETEIHGQIMTDSREMLVDWFQHEPMVYVWGNLLVFYEEGNPRKHLSPDVSMVPG